MTAKIADFDIATNQTPDAWANHNDNYERCQTKGVSVLSGTNEFSVNEKIRNQKDSSIRRLLMYKVKILTIQPLSQR